MDAQFKDEDARVWAQPKRELVEQKFILTPKLELCSALSCRLLELISRAMGCLFSSEAEDFGQNLLEGERGPSLQGGDQPWAHQSWPEG